MASVDRGSDIASDADLSSVPAVRRLHDNAFMDMLRKAVPFEYVTVGGLDLEGYQFGRSRSIDTDMPPLYMETYCAEKMSPQDPLIAVGKTRKTAYTEEEAFDLVPPQSVEFHMKFTPFAISR